MGSAFKIGRAAGIDVKVHWTFFLLLAFFAFRGYEVTGSLVGALTATAMRVALFFCVLLHEFGHSLVAQRLGIGIRDITLLPIGGLSNMESLPEKPADEVKITIAAPLVNVVLALVFFGVALLPGIGPRVPANLFAGVGSAGEFFSYLGYLIVVLALFNLIPAFPFAAAHPPEKYSSVRDLMKTNVPTISSQADLFKDGLRILQQRGLRALPVTENGELVGMLTIEDVGHASLIRQPIRK